MIKLIFENCEVMEIYDEILETYSIHRTGTTTRGLLLVLKKCEVFNELKTQIFNDYRPENPLRNPLVRLCYGDISHIVIDEVSYPLDYKPANSWSENTLQQVTVTHDRVTIKVGIFD